jgi:hypothetical protein
MMHVVKSMIETQERDQLQVIGLSRIPQCAGCERYKVLKAAVDNRYSPAGLPPVPLQCEHQVCAPLVSRIVRSIA